MVKTVPYGRQSIDQNDVDAVVEVLLSDWLTTGPKVAEFEEAFAGVTGARHAVAVCNGTAALHASMYALGIGPGDEVIVPCITFAATANAVVYEGGVPVFADVEADTLLMDPEDVAERITPRTKAIVAVDYAGQPCDYATLRRLAEENDLALVADACHSLGGRYKERPVGALADLSAFSLHPVKPITTGEGGVVTTDDGDLAERMRRFRNHGISANHHERAAKGSWYYEMADLGYNYRITDFQCALGISQLTKLPEWAVRRREIAARYDAAVADMEGVAPLRVSPDVEHAYHLYVIRLRGEPLRSNRSDVFTAFRDAGIGVNVHYVPVHLHPFYQDHFGTGAGLCPVGEGAYEEILTLPLFPTMSDGDQDRVIEATKRSVALYS